MLTSGEMKSLKHLAAQTGLDLSHVRKLLTNAFLAPQIVESLLDGKLDTYQLHLMQKYQRPDWNDQKRLLGISASRRRSRAIDCALDCPDQEGAEEND